MKPKTYKPLIAMALAAIAFSMHSANAAVSLTNGSFESIGTLYNGALGGLFESSGWTNLSSGALFQASSATASSPPNGEFTSGPGEATGLRILRLVSDPNAVGALAQNLGTMTTGETYTISADVFGGPGAGVNYSATISLVNAVSLSPTTTYASQTVSGVPDQAFAAGAFNFSYTATALDNGNDLVLLLRAPTLGAGQATRGGLDNIQLTVIPEPSAALLGALGLLALLRRRR